VTDEIPRLDLASQPPTDERIAVLRVQLPEIFTEDTVDFDALKRSLGEWVDPGPERFGLTWPGKAECMRVIQEPSIGTLVPMPDESVDWDTTQNVIIEGENLEVLKLLQKAYYGKVKLIYIDPPYNTGKEFIYPDNFKEGLADYLRYSGQVDEEGFKLSANAETDGRYHSKWLSMMYPRLFLARTLLREDGVIFVSIDDHEVHNLRALLNETFGEENFIAAVIWQKRVTPENRGAFSAVHDYLLCYARNAPTFSAGRNLLPLTDEARARYSNPDNDPRGDWLSVPATAQAGHATKSQFYDLTTPDGRIHTPSQGRAWLYTKERMEREIADDRVSFGASGTGVPRLKRFLTESRQGLMPSTLWWASDVGANEDGKSQLGIDLGDEGAFDNPKPVGLVKRVIQIATAIDEDDVVLDFFAGSGTTATAVFEQNQEDGGNRRFLMVQLPEGSSKANRSIAAIARARAQGAKERLDADPALPVDADPDRGFRSFHLEASNFSVWQSDSKSEEVIARQLTLAVDHVATGADERSVLTELLLKAGFALTSTVEDVDFGGVEGYSVADGALLVCLSADLTIEAFEAMAELDPAMILVLDAGFGGDDELKVNALQTVRARNQQRGSDIALKVV
jgi:adenine-specific DNA-methyltransferase